MAFRPEGIEELNKNISQYNNGKFHQPIFKVRTYEKGKGRFVLGNAGNKKSKYVQGAPNLFFAVYQDENGKRSFESIPLNIVIEHQKQGLSSVPEKNERGEFLLFHLSPNDLVYVPTEEEQENMSGIDCSNLNKGQVKNLYKVVSFTGNRLYVIPLCVATAIVNKVEYTQLNKIELIKDKQYCIKLKADRLGNISKV